MIQNNESLVVPFFKNVAILNPNASKKAGRPIYKDMEVCEVRIAGDRNYAPVFPAHSMWKRIDGEEITYAQRWKEQYLRFKENAEQIAEGTPLSELPFLTEAKRMELRGLKVYTAEALASLDGKNLHALGPEGRSLKNKATAYLESAAGSSKVIALTEEVEMLKARIAEMSGKVEPVEDDDEPEDVAEEDGERDALKARYKELTGQGVRGQPKIENLRQMVAEAEAR